MDIKQLGYFHAIAEAGGFSAAARRKNISQSALSRQMSLLEYELGVRLFERNVRGAILTDAGVILRDRVGPLLDTVARLKSDLLSQQGEITGKVVLGLTPVMRFLFGTHLIEEFRRDYPAVEFKLLEGLSSTMAAAAESGQTDVSVFVNPDAEHRQLNTVTVMTEPVVIAGPRSTGWRMDQPQPADILSALPLAMSRENRLTQMLVERFSLRGIRLNIAMELEALDLGIDLSRRGLAYMPIPFLAVQEAYRNEVLGAAPIEDLTVDWVIGWTANRPLSAAANILVRVLQRLIIDLADGRNGEGWSAPSANDDQVAHTTAMGQPGDPVAPLNGTGLKM